MAVPFHFHVNILEQCRVSPPPDSIIPPTSLPLTFFDIPWLLYPSNQTLFFFPKPPPKSTTTATVIHHLKHSLSLSLRHFHPLAGNLQAPPPPAEPHLVYKKGDSVSVTVAESNANVGHLSGNHPRSVAMLYSLLPKLPFPSRSRDTHVADVVVLPLLAVQVTVFRDLGLSIGVTAQHAAADERTLDQFVKCWASVCMSLMKKEAFFDLKPQPFFDRTVILDPNSHKATFLKQWWHHRQLVDSPKDHNSYQETIGHNVVQATFLLNSSDIKMIMRHILAKCKMIKEDPPLHLSPYVSACSFIWICLLKSEETHVSNGDTNTSPLYLGFNAGGITRLGYEVPSSYFGNCIAFGRCKALESQLLGEDGVVFAAKSIGKEIKRLDKDVLEGAERWICEWDELNVRVLGSPKVDSYGMDFGWGKVDKVEKLSRDDGRVNHVISLTGSRDVKGGMEIGVVLSRAKMKRFTGLFNGGLLELAIT